jgi:hypothetical protein
VESLLSQESEPTALRESPAAMIDSERRRANSAERRLAELQRGLRDLLRKSEGQYIQRQPVSSKLPSDVVSLGERAGDLTGKKPKT